MDPFDVRPSTESEEFRSTLSDALQAISARSEYRDAMRSELIRMERQLLSGSARAEGQPYLSRSDAHNIKVLFDHYGYVNQRFGKRSVEPTHAEHRKSLYIMVSIMSLLVMASMAALSAVISLAFFIPAFVFAVISGYSMYQYIMVDTDLYRKQSLVAKGLVDDCSRQMDNLIEEMETRRG